MPGLEAESRAEVFVPHAFEEMVIDLGEVRMNYIVAGSREKPALLLIPAQTESWWGYEQVLPSLAEHFQVFAVDLRGQGRSTWTPGRYTLDIMGGDLVRFVDQVIGRPTIVSGNSSGGVLAAWLSAFAEPGQIRGTLLEDAPLFASEANPACGPSIRQAMGPVFTMWHKWLGDQWSIGDWAGMQEAVPRELPGWMLAALSGMQPQRDGDGEAREPAGPPQHMREYDPEWARAFATGTATIGCDHSEMLSSARAPALLTHHFRFVDEASGAVVGGLTDQQARRVGELVAGAGQAFEYRSFPQAAHSMHLQDPELFATTLIAWSETLA